MTHWLKMANLEAQSLPGRVYLCVLQRPSLCGTVARNDGHFWLDLITMLLLQLWDVDPATDMTHCAALSGPALGNFCGISFLPQTLLFSHPQILCLPCLTHGFCLPSHSPLTSHSLFPLPLTQNKEECRAGREKGKQTIHYAQSESFKRSCFIPSAYFIYTIL